MASKTRKPDWITKPDYEWRKGWTTIAELRQDMLLFKQHKRDNQKSKVYAAERACSWWSYGPAPEFRTVPQIQKYLRRLFKRAWFTRRWPRVAYAIPEIRDGRGCRIARGGRYALTLPLWARTKAVILHELAHHICACTCDASCRTLGGWHGPKFVRIYLELIRYEFGKEAADEFKRACKQRNVRYNPYRDPDKYAHLRGRVPAALSQHIAEAACRKD